ncbi:unnamed protein product [Triticum turgidum subsp. durum]|uniref:Importin N-terminal domain-containing protein n=1 Tax=Triticum turgidum subsp. durum TaxID=4567 RepID=A0A9R0THM6_TRITD|nr:unnamed protein product [Triticum turgidum subsp. durum]
MSLDVTQILLSAQSADGSIRKHAEESLKQFQEQNLPGFLLSLSTELATNEKPEESRRLAGLILKNALDAKEQHRKNELFQRWLALDAGVKAQVKALLLQTLSSPVASARSTSSQVIAKIAGIEIPQKQWPELIGSLLSNIHQVQPNVKQATLETLGYLCEEVSPEAVDQDQIDILDEYSSEFTADSDVPCYYFIKQALPALVPMLLETLLKQEDDQDLDEGAWNLAMAGGTCLGLVARTVGDDIVPLVMPFVEENITKPEWRHREAATYAFGSILEGPSADKLTPLVNVALNFMLSALVKDPNNHVKDTTAWTLGRIFEFLHGSALETAPVITAENCQQILTVLLQSMKDVPNVAEKACGALYFLAQGYVDAGSASPLSPFFQDIVQSLLVTSHREDAGESRLRTAAYETLNEVVRCSTEETAPIVMQLVPVIMMELHNTLEAGKLSTDEREKRSDLQGLLCGCLQVIIQKLGGMESTKFAFLQYADQMMDLFLRVFACRNATVHEEAMLAIGALAYAAGSNFAKYMAQFYQYLEMGLQNFEEYQVCAITVGVVGDLCRALEDKILPYCDGIMTQLLKDLSSNQLHRSVKPPIFSCFGDIALAIGENFEKYLIYAMPMLQSAADLSAHTTATDDEMLDYTNQLRNGILEAYSGILQGFKSSPKTQLLMPYAPHILQFLDALHNGKDMDDSVMKTAIGVLGDLADTLGVNAGPLINQSTSSKQFLDECLSSDDPLVKESADWARIAISRAVSG